MSSGPSLGAKLANIHHMPSLIAATVASDKPTDGYITKDIIRMTYESQQTRIFVLDYLTNSLQSTRNVYVKTKVLKLLMVLLQEGHAEFHHGLRKSSDCLRATAVLKTTNMELAGDVGRIRDLANKVLDVLFNTEPVDRPCPFRLSNDPIKDAIIGPPSGPPGKERGSSDKYEGFGNPAFSSSKPTQTGLTSSITKVVGKIFEPPRPPPQYDPAYVTTVPVPQKSQMGGVGGGASMSPFARQIGGGSNQFGPGMTPVGEHVRGRPGGGWDDDPGNMAAPEPGPQVQQQAEVQPQNSSQTDSGPVESSMEQERKLVEEITTPGGIKPAPPRDALNNFISRCKNLDCLAVVECLREKLADDNSQVTLRALFVVEALARSDVPSILSYLDLTLDELSRLTTSGQASIRGKANKLLHLLSTVDSSSTAATTAQITPSRNGTVGDTSTLLTLGNGEEEELTVPSASSSGMSALFKGLTVSGSPATHSASHTHHGHAPPQDKHSQVQQSQRSTGLLAGLTDMTQKQHPSQSLPAQNDPAKNAGPQSPTLLDFGEQDRKMEFDPLTSGQTRSTTSEASSLLSELSSLEAPTQSSSASLLMPTQTTPLVSTQADSTSAFGLTAELAPPTSASMAYSTGLSTGSIGMNPGGIGTSLYTTGNMGMSTGGMSVGVGSSGIQPLGTSTYSPALMNMQVQSGGMVPKMFMSVGIGENRPVQRPPPKQESNDNTSFSFLGRTNKNSAFDFVQDEMKLAGGSPSAASSK